MQCLYETSGAATFSSSSDGSLLRQKQHYQNQQVSSTLAQHYNCHNQHQHHQQTCNNETLMSACTEQYQRLLQSYHHQHYNHQHQHYHHQHQHHSVCQQSNASNQHGCAPNTATTETTASSEGNIYNELTNVATAVGTCMPTRSHCHLACEQNARDSCNKQEQQHYMASTLSRSNPLAGGACVTAPPHQLHQLMPYLLMANVSSASLGHSPSFELRHVSSAAPCSTANYYSSDRKSKRCTETV
jgi:hypothetical protein